MHTHSATATRRTRRDPRTRLCRPPSYPVGHAPHVDTPRRQVGTLRQEIAPAVVRGARGFPKRTPSRLSLCTRTGRSRTSCHPRCSRTWSTSRTLRSRSPHFVQINARPYRRLRTRQDTRRTSFPPPRDYTSPTSNTPPLTSDVSTHSFTSSASGAAHNAVARVAGRAYPTQRAASAVITARHQAVTPAVVYVTRRKPLVRVRVQEAVTAEATGSRTSCLTHSHRYPCCWSFPWHTRCTRGMIRIRFRRTWLTAHVVSDPLASSPLLLVVPLAHAVHTCDDTYSFSAHVVTAHVVSDPLASSPLLLVVPLAHAVHTCDDTYSFSAHVVTAHVVSDPLASSPLLLVVSLGTPRCTRVMIRIRFSAHVVTAHVVSDPLASSPLLLVVPLAHRGAHV